MSNHTSPIHLRKTRSLTAIIFVMSTLTLGINAHAATPNPNADNTAVNERDTSSRALTPLDQSNTQADTDIVAKIRSQLTDDKSLSVNAQNLKVIVRSGVVTLRGPVANVAEKKRVETIVAGVAGVRSTQSEIDVKN